VVGFALMAMYQYMNPGASWGNAYLALAKGIDSDMEGSSNCHNSMKPIGVTIINIFDETKLKSSMPILRVMVN
jgi:hypothetical protein